MKSSQNFVDISIGNVSFYVTNPIVCQVYEGGTEEVVLVMEVVPALPSQVDY